MNRRAFFSRITGRMLGTAFLGASLLHTTRLYSINKLLSGEAPRSSGVDLENIRKQFNLTETYIHMTALLISSHPKPVTDAIQSYQRKLNAENALYLDRVNRKKQNQAREAAANYLDVKASDIALTESTTMGLAMVYNGFKINPEEEIVVAGDDYYSTYESLRWKARQSGAKMVTVDLYKNTAHLQKDLLVERLVRAITPATRLVALTWVHSGTGVKLPVKEISEAIKKENAERPEAKHILLSIDGVHGLGVEDFAIPRLGCDLFIAGCHKWLFGPRGTGIIWGNEKAWSRVNPTVPSFLDARSWKAWQEKKELPTTNAALMSPGGFKAFEHLWALPEVFNFHRQLGKQKIAEHTLQLANEIKHSLNTMEHVTLQTPENDDLSSGIVCFDMEGMSPWTVVNRLYQRKITASVSPYSSRHVRLAPCIYNSHREVETVIKAVRSMK